MVNVSDIYIKANRAFANCNYAEALQLFLAILKDRDKDSSLLLKISQCYEELEQFSDAIKFLSILLDLYIEKGELEKAAGVCKKLLFIDSDNNDVVVKLAEIFEKQERYMDASYYYKIAAQNFEYQGFMDKAIEMLQKVKELGFSNIEELLELVTKAYKKGVKHQLGKNIDLIIKELKYGDEYALLDIALNIALRNEPENMEYIKDLAKLYFKSGDLKRSLELCIFGISIDNKSELFFILVKSLVALGKEELALKILEKIKKGLITLEVKDAITIASNMEAKIKKISVSKLNVFSIDETELNGFGIDLSYLKKSDNPNFNSLEIEKKILIDDVDKEEFSNKTSIIDLKSLGKFSPSILSKIKKAEKYTSEGEYEKASEALFEALKEKPGDENIKNMLNKVIQLSSSLDFVKISKQVETSIDNTKLIVSDLEKYLNLEKPDDLTFLDNFKKKILNKLEKERDYNTVFDLGIGYMEMQMWQDAMVCFKTCAENISESDDRFLESKIYYAYTSALLDSKSDFPVTILKDILKMKLSASEELDVLYYLGRVYELKLDKKKAKDTYKNILFKAGNYRDVDVRLNSIGD